MLIGFETLFAGLFLGKTVYYFDDWPRAETVIAHPDDPPTGRIHCLGSVFHRRPNIVQPITQISR